MLLARTPALGTCSSMARRWNQWARIPALALALVVLASFVSRDARAVQFGAIADLVTGIGSTTVLAFGPEDPDLLSNADGCIYAVNGGTGAVHRVCFDATKAVTSNTIVVDLNGASAVNNVLGIVLERLPASAVNPNTEIDM